MTPSTSTSPAWLAHARGPYGEILPPPLVANISPEDALEQLVQANEKLGAPIRVPTRGHSLQGLKNVALLYVHQMRLRQVLAGVCHDDIERALYEAVVKQGEPLSLRPPSLEELMFATFAPVLQNLTPVRADGGSNLPRPPFKWQVGRPGQGKVESYTESDSAQALARAQMLYVEWCRADEVAFENQIQKALATQPPSLFHDYWLAILEEREMWDFGGGHRLTLLGRHTTMQLDTPTGTRILETERGRAVRIADALARQGAGAPDFPTALQVRAWLGEQNTQPPDQVEWGKGASGLPARVVKGGQEYALVKRQNVLVLHLVKGGQYVKKLAETAIESVIGQWLERGDADGRLALLTWAFWKGGA